MPFVAALGALTTLSTLTACQNDELGSAAPVYTVGDADNAIVLGAGIVEGGAGVSTRATRAIDSNHSKHVLMTENSVMRLLVMGEWWKGAADDSKVTIAKTAIGKAVEPITIGVAELKDTHRELILNPTLNWDDYGTADPNNMDEGRGRKNGLSIYGVTVAGETETGVIDNGKLPTWNPINSDGTLKDNWNKLDWTLDATQTSGWADKDLLISNNVQASNDGTLKFDDIHPTKKATASNLLEFKHAMSKITIRLIASDGFPTSGVGSTTNKFESTPVVKLTSNMAGQTSTAEWTYTKGTVDIKAGTVSPSEPQIITMHTQSTQNNEYTVIYDALIMPGSEFKDKGVGESDPYPTIASINADGNIYYISSKMIRAAIGTAIAQSKHADSFTAQPGKNYVIKVNVKKTKIEVTATIKDWEDVTAEEELPKINITTTYGSTEGTDKITDFCLYRSESDPVNAEKKDMTWYGDGFLTDETNGTLYTQFDAEVTKNDGNWSMSPQLYWPTHSTHYHFRGISPKTSMDTDYGKGKDNPKPRVEILPEASYAQVIKVWNAAYGEEKFPANLAIGMPIVGADVKCDNHNVNVKDYGICATQGKINLTFEYMMSQVEVRLKTSSDMVNLEGAEVEIVNGYTDGYAKIGNREVVVTGTTTENYKLDELASGAADRGENPTIPAANIRHSAIVPQSLTNTSGDLQFKITVYNSGKAEHPDDVDVYTATIGGIQVKESGDTKSIDKWEKGKHYIYTLDIRKTDIKVTATITDWTGVEANEEKVWF